MASTYDDVFGEREQLQSRPPGHDGHVAACINLVRALIDRFEEERNVNDLNEAIPLARHALELRPVENEVYERCGILLILAACFFLRYALGLCPPGHPGRAGVLCCLGAGLTDRFGEKAEICDLEEAIQLGSESIELCSQDRDTHCLSLYTLARALGMKFAQTAVIRDFEDSIKLYRATLELLPSGDPERSSVLCGLSLCLSNRYDKLEVVDDLEEAIATGSEALWCCSRMHRYYGKSLQCLARDLRKRFEKKAAICDLQRAIQLLRSALEVHPTGHRDRFSSLYELALCLSHRHDKLGELDDLEEAITLGREALELRPLGHPNHDVSLQCRIARDLRKRFEKKAAICDLEEAIELLRPALEVHLTGYRDRFSSLYDLALCLSRRHDKYGIANDLEEAILLGHEALKLRSPGNPDRDAVLYSLTGDLQKKLQLFHQAAVVVRLTNKLDLATSLFELSQHFWDLFQKQVTVSDLDNAICLATYALELLLPPEDDPVVTWVQALAKRENSNESVVPGRVVDNLLALAYYHRARFQSQHAIIDLNGAITFYERTLQLCPAGHPNRASSLHDLAQCLADRFRRQPTATDLDKAIVLEQEALELLACGGPSYDISLRCLMDCIQMKIKRQVVIMSSDGSGVTHFDVEQLIRNTAFETLKTMPTRLLHTPTGILCNRDAQMSRFLSSPQYRQLVSLCKTGDRNVQMELIGTEVPRHFQYVTLSHRWGAGEPSLRDIEGQKIYSMPTTGGLGKLQGFCAVTFELGYLWAWSDTCCIDKHSSAEVQETIGSMFTWYRQSALTIVYLSDVPDTGSIGISEWFTRGWTLQELLAPRTILFYTQNWSPYKKLASTNHKKDVVVLEELERVTRIEPRFLTNFSPGMDDARSRLQWASSRSTTRPEDIVYSLFGIFNVHLPVLYVWRHLGPGLGWGAIAVS
ncbi:hypothetical protein EDD17DRAFT_1132097 [Pisolithus thermaeus]|nr:hypothetical protein EDD17DRAFT_1132097 [Pisolithus thermaeus]